MRRSLHPSPLTMYWLFFLLAAPVMSSANIRRAGFGFSDVSSLPSRLFRRQSDCSNCLSTEKCCAGCIASNQDCCDSSLGTYCATPGYTCTPCPAGLTCYTVEGYETAWACCNGSDCPGLITTNPTLNTVPISSTDPTSTHSPSVTPSVTPTSTHSPSVTPSVTPPRVTPPSVAPESKTPSTTAPSTILPTIKPATIPSPSRTLDTDPPIITITRHSSPTIPAPTPSVYTTSGFVRTITPTPTLTTHAAVTINPNGNGDFLVGYCATAQFTGVIDAAGTAIFYIQVVGCIGDKPDCCPISTTDQVSTTATEIVTIFQSQSGAPNPPPNQYLFPSGPSSAIDLVTCPDDYQTISSVCCPSGFQLWTEALGGQTPCYTTTSDHADPPPLTDLPTFSFSASPTISTVVNVVYAMNYPVRKKSGLKTSAIAGIGVGSAVATALVAALVYAVLRSRRTRDRDSTQYPPMVVQPYSPMQAYSPVYPAMQSDDYVRPP